ncbi:hypothetical protein ABG067_005407 [Albugo candida]
MKLAINGFHVVVWQILTSRIQGHTCPFKEKVKCVLSKKGTEGAVRVRFLSGRLAESFYACKPDILTEYDLTPEGSGAKCDTFQYHFHDNKLVMSTDPIPAYPVEYKGANKHKHGWSIKFNTAKYRKKGRNSNTAVEETPLQFDGGFFFNFDVLRIVLPATFVRFKEDSTYEFTFIQGRPPHDQSLTLESISGKCLDVEKHLENGIFGRVLTKSKQVSFVKTSHETFEVIVGPAVPKTDKSLGISLSCQKFRGFSDRYFEEETR